MVALRERDVSGEGQVVDVNLLESMVQMMSALPSAAAHLDYVQPRLGSGIPYSVPRGTYQCADGEWIAISTSSESVAHRVLTLLGVADDPRFATFESRAGHREELDAIVGEVGGRVPSAEVLAEFDAVAGRDRARVLDARPARGSARHRAQCVRERRRRRDAGAGRAPFARRRARCGSRAARSAPTPTRCSASCDDRPHAGFVLVASPFTGPFAWSQVATASASAAGASRCTASTTPIEGPLVLVADSGGGPQLPALVFDAAACRAWCSWTRCCRIRVGAGPRPCPRSSRPAEGGRRRRPARPWPHGGATSAMRELIPDDELRDAFVRACPAVPVE